MRRRRWAERRARLAPPRNSTFVSGFVFDFVVVRETRPSTLRCRCGGRRAVCVQCKVGCGRVGAEGEGMAGGWGVGWVLMGAVGQSAVARARSFGRCVSVVVVADP